MKLVKLYANKNSFHTVNFNSGLNIIVGKQLKPSNKNDGNTYNGVGKSLIVHLLHFCLGCNKIDEFAENLKDWEFFLDFEIEKESHTVKRKTSNQNIIVLDGKEYGIKDFRNHMLGLCFGLNGSIKFLTWETLLSRFLRRFRSSYTNFKTATVKEQDYVAVLNDIYLLGLNIDLMVKKKELREQQLDIQKKEKILKTDPLFKLYYLGKHNIEIDEGELRSRINLLEAELKEFKVANNYHELEKEANDKSYEKKKLENERVLVNNNIKNIQESLSDAIGIDRNDVFKIYQEANIEIPDMVKKNVEDVLFFHFSLLENRNKRLKIDLQKQLDKLDDIDSKIHKLGVRIDELLSYLDTHGALEEYVALTKQLTKYNLDLLKIKDYRSMLKDFQDKILDIKQQYIILAKNAANYLDEQKNLIDELRETFSIFAKRFYPKKASGLVITNNSGENTVQYDLEARIQDDSSDGINEVKIFCFDFLLLLCKISKIRFLMHDSRVFSNMDPRQREVLFRLAYEKTCTEAVQYICTINEDILQTVKSLYDDKEYEKEIQNNIILRLTDDSAESKLLGIQFDVDLEEPI